MMKTKTLKQVIQIKADPHTIYETFMDSKLHSKLIDAPAVIERKQGGKFSVWDGYATGENLELIKDRHIMQSWRANDWEEGAVSKVTFALRKIKGGTQITFTQTGIPPAQLKSISQGWVDFYWKRLKKLYK